MTYASPRAVLLMAALALARVLAPDPAAAQERITVRTEPGTPVVGTEVLIATGPAGEAEGELGLAYLSARAVTAPIRERLEELGAHLSVEAHKDALAFSLIAAPDAWPEAVRTLLIALLRDPADSQAVARERDSIHSSLLAREANPADALDRELDQAFFGPDHPWRHSEVGYAATVGGLTVADVQQFLRKHFVPEQTVVAVVGPVQVSRVREHLLPYVGTGELMVQPIAAPQPVEAPVERDYNSITTWVAASYRFPPNADLEAIRLLAHLAAESLSFGPSRRSIYDVEAEVLPRRGGGELRLQVVVPPEEAEEWTARMLGVISRFEEDVIDDVTFAGQLRQYRGERLLELRTPEDRARELARQLLTSGGLRGLSTDPTILTPQGLRDAARALSSPAVVFLGPFLDDFAPEIMDNEEI